jgi:hypothetical protein
MASPPYVLEVRDQRLQPFDGIVHVAKGGVAVDAKQPPDPIRRVVVIDVHVATVENSPAGITTLSRKNSGEDG